MLRIDARIAIVLGRPDQAKPDDALLIEGDAPAPAGHPVARLRSGGPDHPGGCLCCVPRGAIAEALSRLFLARARGEIPFFRRVVAALDDPGGLHAALRSDPAIAAWYRLEV